MPACPCMNVSAIHDLQPSNGYVYDYVVCSDVSHLYEALTICYLISGQNKRWVWVSTMDEFQSAINVCGCLRVDCVPRQYEVRNVVKESETQSKWNFINFITIQSNSPIYYGSPELSLESELSTELKLALVRFGSWFSDLKSTLRPYSLWFNSFWLCSVKNNSTFSTKYCKHSTHEKVKPSNHYFGWLKGLSDVRFTIARKV